MDLSRNSSSKTEPKYVPVLSRVSPKFEESAETRQDPNHTEPKKFQFLNGLKPPYPKPEKANPTECSGQLNAN